MEPEKLHQIANKLLEAGLKLKEMVYDLYKSEGCPYGETEKGMMKWLKERRKKTELEYRENCEREIKAMIKEIEENQKEAINNERRNPRENR